MERRRWTRIGRATTALCAAGVCASAALVLAAAPAARPAGPEVSYSGCLERIARNQDAFILANVVRNQPGQPPRGYDVLSNEMLRLEAPAGSPLDFGTWEGYVVVATGTIDARAPRPKDPLFRTPWGKRFVSLPVLQVTSYQHLAGTLPCPA
ncbi:MAG: hypothetical protein KGN76_10335 [Acidobacteriota bacterium]|nr:hypothetical protein [Acidobacteriota bacterium]